MKSQSSCLGLECSGMRHPSLYLPPTPRLSQRCSAVRPLEAANLFPACVHLRNGSNSKAFFGVSALQGEAEPACCGEKCQAPPADSWSGRACPFTSSACKMAAVTSDVHRGQMYGYAQPPQNQGFQYVVSGVSPVDHILSRFPGSCGLTRDPPTKLALLSSLPC